MSVSFETFADEIEALRTVAEGYGDEFSNDEILALELAQFPGAVENEQLADEALERLDELLEHS